VPRKRVDSEGTSEIALGEKGAERLLGRGHMLAKLEAERDLCFAQVPLVDPEFADEVVAATIRPDAPHSRGRFDQWMAAGGATA
jgi:DNA segregation ATPase FtsK/SpoIIIE-like protein